MYLSIRLAAARHNIQSSLMILLSTCTIFVNSKVYKTFKRRKIMAIDIKVIPTLRGDEAVRFVEKAEEVMNSNNRVDFSAKVAEARAILRKAGF